MRTIFSPAIGLMNCMGYTKKFTVLWLLSFVAIAVVACSLFVSLNQTIRSAEQQLAGLALVESVARVEQLLQQHRGLSSAVLSGDQMMRDRRAAKETDVAGVFGKMEEKLPPALASSEDFRRIKASWEQVRKEGLHWTKDENFTAHTGLVKQIRLFLAIAADEYALSMDAAIGTFYLIDTIVNKLPDALEHFGQIRAYGTGILAKKQITEQQKIKLNSLIVELDSALEELQINLEKTIRDNRGMQESVAAVSRDITGSARYVIGIVKSDILAGRFATTPNDFFNIATAAIDKSYAQMYDSLLPTAEALIKARIARAKNMLWVSIGIASLLFLLVAYFSVGIYYAVTSSIQSLAHSARAFVNGDMDKRVQINTRDELSRVGDIFNEMADGFNALLDKHRAFESIIWKQANFDTLTGLPNRRMFLDRLGQEIKKAHRAELKVALLFIDLDEFKEINDTLGHTMGDILLKEVARRIGSCVRDSDTVARLGGDEFTVILSELGDTGNVERVIECIRHKLTEPFHLEDNIVYVSCSTGITLYPDDAADMEDMIKNADQAMYAAKNKGHNRFEYFTQSMQQTAQTRLRLTNDLRGALSAGQFKVYFQPIMDLATGHVHKAEALIRWKHPELGMVSPDQFIPLAEETGMIIEIGVWVFKEAAQQVKRLTALCDRSFQVSVNVSPVQLRQTGNTCKACLDYLNELGLPEQSIVIEITEGLLLEAEGNITDKLLAFRNGGVPISIDDFGTGYSSLSYLKKFDIDYLKIDQSFVRNLVTDSNDMVLSEAIIVMAHKLGMKVIAEGVETEEQRKLLSDAGCDYAQGYLFSRPVPVEEFEELLIQNSGCCSSAAFPQEPFRKYGSNYVEEKNHETSNDYATAYPVDGGARDSANSVFGYANPG